MRVEVVALQPLSEPSLLLSSQPPSGTCGSAGVLPPSEHQPWISQVPSAAHLPVKTPRFENLTGTPFGHLETSVSVQP